MTIRDVIWLTTIVNFIIHLPLITCRLAEPTEEPAQAIVVTDATTTPMPPVNLTCFHQPEENCPAEDSKCKCKRIYSNAAICCNVDIFYLADGLGCAGVGATDDVIALHVRNATLDFLKINSTFKRLTSMSVTDGNIKSLSSEFPKLTSIECLNLSNNGLTGMEFRALVNLHKLTTLDLSHNNFETIPNFDSRPSKLSLDISYNKPFQCSSLYDALLTNKKNITFLHKEDTFCLSSVSFQWFNSTEQVAVEQVERLVELKTGIKCPEIGNQKCNCEPHRFEIVEGKPSTVSMSVDCSFKNLTSLPEILPSNTIKLNVSYNNITSLRGLKNESSYHDLRELYAEHNQINSITEMEGSAFMQNFMVLNLRHNDLEEIPFYLLLNTIDRNLNRYIYLGQNKLECDCDTMKDVTKPLLSHQKHFPDFKEILCRNLPEKVIDITQEKVCQRAEAWTDYIYYIIGVEVFLFVGLIVKVLYDYWIFKTAGYLPWPANKMPKLPCDCLCET